MAGEDQEKNVRVAVIGGSGLYHIDQVEFVRDVFPETVINFNRLWNRY